MTGQAVVYELATIGWWWSRLLVSSRVDQEIAKFNAFKVMIIMTIIFCWRRNWLWWRLKRSRKWIQFYKNLSTCNRVHKHKGEEPYKPTCVITAIKHLQSSGAWRFAKWFIPVWVQWVRKIISIDLALEETRDGSCRRNSCVRNMRKSFYTITSSKGTFYESLCWQEILHVRLLYKRMLKNHRTIHTRVRPYECYHCKKSFQWGSDLLKHKKCII